MVEEKSFPDNLRNFDAFQRCELRSFTWSKKSLNINEPRDFFMNQSRKAIHRLINTELEKSERGIVM